ncbi:MAG: hypothetical protein D6731_09635 [Planctomycetota bacterium]|nr:MAG: hypothetical protein D6731_09635 [Planctomycetota bacterium]
MSTKAKRALPTDPHTLARWLAIDPKQRLGELEQQVVRASAAAFAQRGALYRIALKRAWDEQPEALSTPLRAWLKSKNARLRKLAAGALPLSHETEGEKSVRALKKLATDKDRAVRLTAIDLLAEDPLGHSELLRRWAKDADPAVRECVARSLRAPKAETLRGAFALLESLALDPEPRVHWAAASTLLELYGREARPALEIARAMASHDDPAIRSAVACMFFEHVFAEQFAQLQPTLRAWLRAGTPHLRWTLVRSLRFTPVDARSLQLLRALYEDKDPDIRRRVIELLLDRYDPDDDHRRTVTAILRRARDDSSRRIRDLIAEGHERHGEDYLEPYAAPIEDDAAAS